MAQTKQGAAKSAAANAGLELDDFLARIAAGMKRCTRCKEWKARDTFNVDRSRSDGLSAAGHCCTRVREKMCVKGRPSTFKGKTHSAEARAKMSRVRLGRPGPNKGGTVSLERRALISAATRKAALRGVHCPAYIDGRSKERKGERFTDAYKQWRYDVMLRDRFTCRHCLDDRGGNLHAHHIKPFATHPDLRLVVSNGITLCKGCHKAVHAAK